MTKEKSNIEHFFLKAFFILLLVTSFALVNRQSSTSEDRSVIKTELSTSTQINAAAIAASQTEIPTFETNWTFGSNDNFMALGHHELRNFYCEISLTQRQKYFQVLFLSFKEKLDKQNFTFYLSQSKEAPVSFTA
ncbi:MAG: hypothetical protein P1P88_06640 [Bacteroidales bacterium]|nr:hypothetical protein [Bacteroidales bacterium]